MSQLISLLIVDDHDVVRQGVRAYLEAGQEFVVVGEAESGAAAVQSAAEKVPDVVLMDLLMPDMDGVEATRQIKRLSPRTQIVVLTSHHDDTYIFSALRAGAISYLLKSVKMEDLAEALHRAARGEATLDPQVAARVIQEIQGLRQLGESINPFTDLTDREMEILKLIAQGLSNQAITAHLVISEHTVKGHVSNILSKLQLADRTQAAIFAWREGIVRRE